MQVRGETERHLGYFNTVCPTRPCRIRGSRFEVFERVGRLAALEGGSPWQAWLAEQDETTRRFEFSSAGTMYRVTLELGPRGRLLARTNKYWLLVPGVARPRHAQSGRVPYSPSCGL